MPSKWFASRTILCVFVYTQPLLSPPDSPNTRWSLDTKPANHYNMISHCTSTQRNWWYWLVFEWSSAKSLLKRNRLTSCLIVCNKSIKFFEYDNILNTLNNRFLIMVVGIKSSSCHFQFCDFNTENYKTDGKAKSKNYEDSAYIFPAQFLAWVNLKWRKSQRITKKSYCCPLYHCILMLLSTSDQDTWLFRPRENPPRPY